MAGENVEKIYPEFAAWFREQVEDIGYDQSRIAREVGVSHVSAHNWLHGKSRPRDGRVLQKLAAIFGTHIDIVISSVYLDEGGLPNV